MKLILKTISIALNNLRKHPWLLFIIGTPTVFIISFIQTNLYMDFLIANSFIRIGGLALFEPLYILPLVFLDYFSLLCLLSYSMSKKVFTLGLAGLALSIHVLVIIDTLAEKGVKYDLADGIFRVVLGTIPSGMLVVSCILLLCFKKVYSTWKISQE